MLEFDVLKKYYGKLNAIFFQIHKTHLDAIKVFNLAN
jgi:hypothetical protein